MDRPFEYLHGLYYKDKGKLKFKDLWAKKFDRESEKNIFIELINFFEKRFENTLMLISIIMHPMKRGQLES
jgi:uncharacterized protein